MADTSSQGPAWPCERCGSWIPLPVDADGRFSGEVICPQCGEAASISVMRASGSPSTAPSPEAEYQRRLESIEESQRQRHRAAAMEVDFPVFGLDRGWGGLRSIGGFVGAERIERLALIHGDHADPEAPAVRVETHRHNQLADADADADGARLRHVMAARWLARELIARGVADERLTATLRSKAPTPGWDHCTIDVSGEPYEFRCLQFERHAIAIGSVGGQLIAIESQSVPIVDVHLVALDDLSPYLD